MFLMVVCWMQVILLVFYHIHNLCRNIDCAYTCIFITELTIVQLDAIQRTLLDEDILTLSGRGGALPSSHDTDLCGDRGLGLSGSTKIKCFQMLMTESQLSHCNSWVVVVNQK